MTTAKHFGHPTSWGKDPSGSSFGGWYSPGADYYIGPADPVWGSLLDEARKTYGDKEIHFDTGKTWEDRHLVFGDGTPLPADGTVVYRDRSSGQNWVQNDDGTAALVGPDGRAGAPVTPAGYRKINDGYAPVDAAGRQIAPQLGGVPGSDNGFHTDPATGVLTPKNADGAYYTLGPDGTRSYFDRHGAPISEAVYRGTPTNQPPQPDAGPPTTEQQSGRAAEAVRKLQSELKQRFSAINDAEERLSEILLTARTATATGQGTLNDIQRRIVEAVNSPAMDTSTAAGEKAYLTFLRSQATGIRDALATASLTADQQSGAAQALATLYGAADDPAPGGPSQPAAPVATPPADPGAGTPAPSMPDLVGSEPADPLTGFDPAWTDLPAASIGPEDSGAASPLSQMAPLASMLPGALGGLGAGSPLDGLGGLVGAAGPLAGLGSQLGAPAASDARDRAESSIDKPEPAHHNEHDPADRDTADKPERPKTDTAEHTADPAASLPTGPAAPIVPAASPTVKLPDGSTANARTPQAAQAIRDWLAGNTVDGSYRQNGITLPPPGTPVTAPVDPSRLACGDVAMFRDHYEPVLSSVKGYLNGQVVPLSTVTSRPDFLGFIDPTASAAAHPIPAPAPAVVAAPVPAG
ncbi:DUF4226 domain-containing protein [Mycolicibacterium llatzerense]|uniref:DUF4226 domain-containing protein n=1 Tax=Mycolicibacterium llatzerense TaxID=280871 RepID=UPI0008DDFBB5|nr:DUF4226 domain-containing protein [Mycolicibacterium llatzerense]